MRSPDWAVAEDAFLEATCTIEPLPYGARYSAPSQPTIRLNALRVTDPAALGVAGWTAALEAHRAFFHARGLALTLQLPEPHEGAAFPGSWKRVGPRFVHVVTNLADLGGISPVAVELRPLTTEVDRDAYASMLIRTRVPRAMWDVARPVILASVQRVMDADAVHAFLVHQGQQLVGQVALTEVRDGFTASILTVVEEHRGQGLMKAIYAAVAQTFDGPLYGQIIEGVATLAFRERLPSTRRLAHTRTWQALDDPYLRSD